MVREYEKIQDGLNIFTLGKLNDDFKYLFETIKHIPKSSTELFEQISDQIQNIEANGTIYANKGVVFPLEARNSNRNIAYENGILDVVVHYADTDALYKINHISKDNTAWGNPVTFVQIQKSTDGGSNWDQIVGRNEANLPNDQSGVNTNVIKHDGMDEIFTITLDWSAFAAGSNNEGIAGGDFIISPNRYLYATKRDENNLPEYYENAGLVYPMENRGSDRLAWLDNAILDLKVHYADTDAIYRISHISKDNTAWGNPLTFFQIDKSFDNGLNWSLLIARNAANISNNQSGVKTHVITSNSVQETFTITINWNEIRTGSNNVTAYADYIISPINYFFRQALNNTGNDLGDNIVINKSGRKLQVKHKLNDDENIIVIYNKLRNNDFHEMGQFVVQKNTAKDNDFNGDLVMSTGTDFVSPYGIMAVNNPVSGSAGSITVGGAHGTDGGSGHPTGRFGQFNHILLDGEPVNDGITKGKNLEIEVEHYVSASNAVNKTTGDKRDSMMEIRNYNITARHHNIHITLKALEVINLTRYAGLQLTQPEFYHSMYRYKNKSEGILPVKGLESGFHIAEEKDFDVLDRVILFNDKSMLVMLTDRKYGIGDGHLAPESTTENEQSPINITGGNFGKIYSHNLGRSNNIVRLEINEELAYRGGYYFVENQSTVKNIFEYEINGVTQLDDMR